MKMTTPFNNISSQKAQFCQNKKVTTFAINHMLNFCIANLWYIGRNLTTNIKLTLRGIILHQVKAIQSQYFLRA